MPNISSGPISLANINTQFGYTSTAQIVMGTNPIALGAGSYTANITQMNGFYYTQSGTQQGSKLLGTGATGAPSQGYSVALSSDGNTLAVGGIDDNSFIGATWVFTRSGSTWTQQGSKLVGTGYVGTPSQGEAVSLSADGNTLAVGGYGDNGLVGAVWVFTRSGSTWTQQGNKLVGTGYVGSTPYQGISVSLSDDGNTLAVGGSNDGALGGVGAVWVFTRSGTVWSQQGSKLVGTGATGNAAQGGSVSLSVDGNTLAVGGTGDSSGLGATWIFTRSGSTWTQQGSKLTGTGAVSPSLQGDSSSLSVDGNTLVVGGPRDNSFIGATWVFTRSGSTWTQQGSKLVGTGYVGAPQQGASVSISADGNTLAVGGPKNSSNTGAVWLFTRSGSVWTQQGSGIVGTGAVGSAEQGSSVSVNGNGNTLVVGGFKDNTNTGATWIFT